MSNTARIFFYVQAKDLVTYTEVRPCISRVAKTLVVVVMGMMVRLLHVLAFSVFSVQTRASAIRCRINHSPQIE